MQILDPRHLPPTFQASKAVVIHWIASDDRTAAEIRHRWPAMNIDVQPQDPVSFALAQDSPNLLLLPGKTPGLTVIARLKPVKKHTVVTQNDSSPAWVPSGFLGLSDAPMLDDEPEPVRSKKSWWPWRKAA